MTVERTGADAICAALAECGVETVFGVPGTQTVALYESLRRSGLRTITATDERAATFMAQGYFRASGRLAAVSAIPGPGFSFALSALPEAMLGSVALLLMTGRPPMCPIGRRRAQAIDQPSMAAPAVKGVFDVGDVRQVERAISEACALAVSGEPGPVLLQVAADVLRQRAGTTHSTRRTDVTPRDGAEPALREAARFCAAADKTLIYVGQGAADAARALRAVVYKAGALVATTPSARGVFPEDDARLLPLDATNDADAFNEIAAECDAIIVLGAALSENGTVGFGLDWPQDKLVRVDASPTVLSLPPAARFAVRASCGAFLQALIDELECAGAGAQARGFDPAAAQLRRARFRDRRAGGASDSRVGGGDASAFFSALRRALPADGCLVLDSGLHQLLARRHWVALQPRGLIFPTDFQSMAYGLPAGIGAKLAQPERALAVLLGDGGFAMSGMELRTAAALRLNLPVIVFDDRALGLIRMDQLLSYGRAHATALPAVDYAAFARAVGCAFDSADGQSIEAALQAALARKGPTLIVVAVGDAPALRRAARRHRMAELVKSALGKRWVEALRSLRNRV